MAVRDFHIAARWLTRNSTFGAAGRAVRRGSGGAQKRLGGNRCIISKRKLIAKWLSHMSPIDGMTRQEVGIRRPGVGGAVRDGELARAEAAESNRCL